MLLDQLKRIEDFRGASPSELRSLTERAQLLSVPANRSLIRPQSPLSGYYYLLRGEIRTQEPTRRLRAASTGLLAHFYPGCRVARTISSCQLLRLEAHHRDFLLLNQRRDQHAVAELNHFDGWLARFLGSHMMAKVSAEHWQRLLTGFRAESVGSGTRVLRRGDLGAHCYVIESGHALVHQGEYTLNHLNPGDFFGEDALVLNSRRTADVTAIEPMRVHRIEQGLFSDVLLNTLVRFVQRAAGGVLIHLGGRHKASPSDANAVAVRPEHIRQDIRTLNPSQQYYICGSGRSQRALCALLMVQQGLRAQPLLE